MRELLDLGRHAPEEYEGKIVRWDDYEYWIGRHLADGNEMIVHHLLNSRTGLALHVIKIWRDPKRLLERMKAGHWAHLRELILKELAACTVFQEKHGGLYDIQELLATARDEKTYFDSTSVVKEIEEAEFLSRTDGEKALKLYRVALEKCPLHTRALQESAEMHWKLELRAEALRLIRRSLATEKHDRIVWRVYTKMHFEAGHILIIAKVLAL
jgi:hypothetical protein